MKTLSDICEVYSGYALKEFNDQNEGLPVIKIGNIMTDGTLTLEDCQYTSEVVNEKYYSKKGDIYVALSGATTGKIGILESEERHVINQRVGVVRRKNYDVPQQFVKYFLMRQTDRILQEASGCAQPNISPKQIAQYEVPKLSKTEMEEISNILDKLSYVITQRKDELQKLDELIKARFVEMFGDVILNDKNWQCKAWADVLTIVNGRNQKDVEAENGEYLICGSGGPMSRATNYLTNENSVIIGRKGNINKPILMREKFWNVDTAFGLEPDTMQIMVEYLYLYCVLFDFEKLNKAVTIPSLTKTDLLKIEMPIPNFALQKKFAEFCAQVDKSKVVALKAA